MNLKLSIFALTVAGCSSSNFSGSGQRGANNAPSSNATPKESINSPAPEGSTSPDAGELFLVTDITTGFVKGVLAEGLQGSCVQEPLPEGRSLLDDVVIPALRKMNISEVISLQVSPNSDVLLTLAAMSCGQGENVFSRTTDKSICSRTLAAGQTGSLGMGATFGVANICGDSYPDQSPVFTKQSDIDLLNVTGAKPRQVFFYTYKMGSAMPPAKFVEHVRRKLGAETTISVIYPKTRAQCETKKIIPPANDTSWSALHPSSISGSKTFEDIASISGGRTFDLCDRSALDKIGKP